MCCSTSSEEGLYDSLSPLIVGDLRPERFLALWVGLFARDSDGEQERCSPCTSKADKAKQIGLWELQIVT